MTQSQAELAEKQTFSSMLPSLSFQNNPMQCLKHVALHHKGAVAVQSSQARACPGPCFESAKAYSQLSGAAAYTLMMTGETTVLIAQ